MSNGPAPVSRRSIRLKGYDYTHAGFYFVTICCHARISLFGEISDEVMHLSEFGHLAEAEWLKTGAIRANVELDEYIVMPNHFHGILIISGVLRRARLAVPLRRPDSGGLSSRRWPPLFGRSNLAPRDPLTNCGMLRVCQFGNATTTSTSSGTTCPSTVSENIY